MTQKAILTFNIGSSSIKFSMFTLNEAGRPARDCLRGSISDIYGTPHIRISGEGLEADKAPLDLTDKSDPAGWLGDIANWLTLNNPEADIVGIGHRVVHGGQIFNGPVIATHTVLESLKKLSVFVPAHQPFNLSGVVALQAQFRSSTHTLSFDTAFHRQMPRVAELYAIPYQLSDSGLIRYGFHGLSYAHIVETLSVTNVGSLPKKIVALHLGSGASACAILEGKSVATTMGLTALDGLPMASRSGEIDPGLVLHLIDDRGYSTTQISELLYKQSGLLGVSGVSSDLRQLLGSDDPRAREAIDLYCYRIARHVGSLAVALEGLDWLVFTGGVGENSPEIRSRIIAHLKWLGPIIDESRNLTNAFTLSPPNARVSVFCIPADEERIIAEECASLLR